MKLDHLLALAIGLFVGGFLVVLLRPAPEPTLPSEDLIDGRYLIVEGADGHWIYEKGENGLEVKIKELSPSGLQAIWGLQSKYLPHSVETSDGLLVNVPATRYSTETGTFQVVHKFYRHADSKLVEVEMEVLKPE